MCAENNKPPRTICDASKQGAVLQQSEEIAWEPISYASRFLTELETKYFLKEIEILAVVWSVDHKRYVYGVNYWVVSDHKALRTVLVSNKGNETFSSKSTSWVDRLLLFDFTVAHTPGRTLRMADFLSRHPSPYEVDIVEADEMLKNKFTIIVGNESVPTMHTTNMANQAKPINLQKDSKREQEQLLTVHAPVPKISQSKHVIYRLPLLGGINLLPSA